MKEKVAIVRVVDRDVHAAVERTVDLVGGFYVEPNSSVMIKPNLCVAASPDRGVTTDVRVVEAVIQLLKKSEPSCSVLVVESDSHGRSADETFTRLGFLSLMRKYGVELVNLSKDDYIALNDAGETVPEAVNFPRRILYCEEFISIAKLKTHVWECISGALKNQFGCIANKNKFRFHPYLSEVLACVNDVINPGLCLIDGIVGLEGRGPTGGQPKKANLVIAGKNPVAVDFVACLVMGIKPQRVPHLRYAMRRQRDVASQIEIVGEPLERVAMKFRLPRRSEFLLHRLSFHLQRLGCERLKRFASRAAGFYGRSKDGFLKTTLRSFMKIAKG